MQMLFDKIKNAGFDARDGYVYFGEYPRTIKADGVTVSDGTDGRGYYLGSDGCYYAKALAKPYDGECKFSSGEAIAKGKEYYFKVEPIRWRVLGESDGGVLLQCDGIIDCKRFDEKTAAYADSEIRAWLNGEFYKRAFCTREQEKIEAVNLASEANGSDSRKISDKVFLLSFSEVGTSQDKRVLKASDFGIAMGVTVRFAPSGIFSRYTEDNYADGTWWLRSRIGGNTNATVVDYVDFYGGVGGADYVYYSRNGVVAALQIRV